MRAACGGSPLKVVVEGGGERDAGGVVGSDGDGDLGASGDWSVRRRQRPRDSFMRWLAAEGRR